MSQKTKLQEAEDKKHYAVILMMVDEEKNATYREDHLQFLAELRAKGTVFAQGRFVDGAGGLVIYRADTFEEVERLVNEDPYVKHGARDYKIHEWAMLLAEG